MCNNDDSLLINVLKILPEEIDCYIQAPSLENESILNMMSETEWDYYKLIKINNLNKESFCNSLNDSTITQYFQNIELKNSNKMLFQGFDGVEIGIISKYIKIPIWFRDKYIISGDCTISIDW
ncbi:MAG TPA: hypothetical protein PK504_13495 [Ferruginibacter sp.]|nr:hypothetical protein [Ferruginibacter sp.]